MQNIALSLTKTVCQMSHLLILVGLALSEVIRTLLLNSDYRITVFDTTNSSPSFNKIELILNPLIL